MLITKQVGIFKSKIITTEANSLFFLLFLNIGELVKQNGLKQMQLHEVIETRRQSRYFISIQTTHSSLAYSTIEVEN